MKVVYIHGHKADQSCWNHVQAGVGGSSIFLNYDSNKGFDANLKEMNLYLAHANRQSEDTFFVAHSLGGIYARMLATISQAHNCIGGVTISTPYGGCEMALVLKRFDLNNPIFDDIHPLSPVITEVKQVDSCVRWTNVVTIGGGNPLWLMPNDGVVSVFSQICLRHKMNLIHVDKTHFNILEWDGLPAIINSEIFTAQRN